jgi:hypothetical protein
MQPECVYAFLLDVARPHRLPRALQLLDLEAFEIPRCPWEKDVFGVFKDRSGRGSVSGFCDQQVTHRPHNPRVLTTRLQEEWVRPRRPSRIPKFGTAPVRTVRLTSPPVLLPMCFRLHLHVEASGHFWRILVALPVTRVPDALRLDSLLYFGFCFPFAYRFRPSAFEAGVAAGGPADRALRS